MDRNEDDLGLFLISLHPHPSEVTTFQLWVSNHNHSEKTKVCGQNNKARSNIDEDPEQFVCLTTRLKAMFTVCCAFRVSAYIF